MHSCRATCSGSELNPLTLAWLRQQTDIAPEATVWASHVPNSCHSTWTCGFVLTRGMHRYVGLPVYGLRNSAGDGHLGCAGLGWAVYVGSRAHMSKCMGSADEGVPSSPLGSAWVLCAPTCLALGW